MKKLFLVLLISAIGPLVIAQGVFSLGPKIGFNSNTLTENIDSINAGIKNTFQIGAFVRIGSKVYLQPEVNYQLVSGTLNKSLGSIVLHQDITIKTIKVPALIGVKLIQKGPVNLRVMAGPTFTYLFDKKLDPSKMNELWPIQSVDDLKNSIWSVQMGAGLDVLFMTLDVRYELGVENMYNGSSSFDLKNNTFNVSLGIKLL
jgi:hypothetical protein